MRAFNSTIKLKKKKCIECGQMEYIFSKGRCQQCAKVHSVKQKDEEENIEDTESVTILKKDADLIFSRLIRLRAATPETGLLNCYICNKSVHYSLAHAMHFVPREDSIVRLHPKNVRAGCFECNVTKGGNFIEYRKRLDEEENLLSDWLEAQARAPYKYWREELKRQIADWTREINHLKKIKQLK